MADRLRNGLLSVRMADFSAFEFGSLNFVISTNRAAGLRMHTFDNCIRCYLFLPEDYRTGDDNVMARQNRRRVLDARRVFGYDPQASCAGSIPS
jgi:hypothetical protein